MNGLIKKIIVLIYSLKLRIVLNKRILKIFNSLPSIIDISSEKIQYHKKLWKDLNNRTNIKWYKVFASINGIDDPRYITEYDYHFNVELRLNHKGFSEAYSDKNSYHRNFMNELLPQIYLRNINGVFYTEKYEYTGFEDAMLLIPDCIEKCITKKSTESGGGRGIELFTRNNAEWVSRDGEKLSVSYLDKQYGSNYIIQEYIDQHPYFSQFNQSSLNTVRLFTYRSVVSNEVIPLHAVLRIGKPGSLVDNQASGGIACGVKENGKLNSFAINKKGEKFDHFNTIVFSNADPVFKFDEIVKICLPLANQFYYHRLLGFDFCVDHRGNIRLIEVNNKNNETNFFQMNNGPLFGEYTDEIISYCKNSKRNFNFDFDI